MTATLRGVVRCPACDGTGERHLRRRAVCCLLCDGLGLTTERLARSWQGRATRQRESDWPVRVERLMAQDAWAAGDREPVEPRC